MRRTVLTAVCLLALLTGCTNKTVTGTPTAPVTITIVPLPSNPLAPPEVRGIEEDDPRWDCKTMGNRTCGVGND